jgi:hypothetical protein
MNMVDDNDDNDDLESGSGPGPGIGHGPDLDLVTDPDPDLDPDPQPAPEPASKKRRSGSRKNILDRRPKRRRKGAERATCNNSLGRQGVSKLPTSVETIVEPNQSLKTQSKKDARFSEVKLNEINNNAFNLKSNGTNRTSEAAQRNKSRAGESIAKAVSLAGINDEQRALALYTAMMRPEMLAIAKAAGFDPLVNVHRYNCTQISKVLARSLDTPKRQGRPNNDRQTFAGAAIAALVPSPSKKRNPAAPSMRQQAESLNLPWTTARRKMRKGEGARGVTKSDKHAKYLLAPTRKIVRKLTKELIILVQKWICDHPMVANSPIANDTLLVFDEQTQKKSTRVGKLLLQIPLRELHNNLVEASEKNEIPGLLHDGRCVVSDTALRNILPKNLRRATQRHKQMCGCETCLQPRSQQECLNRWRERWLRSLAREAKEELDTEVKALKQKRYDTYKSLVKPGGNTWHERPHHAVKEIMCQVVDVVDHHKFACVLRQCKLCPPFPVPLEEKDESDDAPTITFHQYEHTTKCTKHGLLPLASKTCERCELLEEGVCKKKGKIATRKELTLLTRPIGEFIVQYYLPGLEKLAYHLPHVKILSKRVGQCAAMRYETFKKEPGWFMVRRDYAERLLAEFDLEVQSTHFGNHRSLSMEGSAVEFFPANDQEKIRNGETTTQTSGPILESHSHFSDGQRQDAATTYEHTETLISNLKARHILLRGCVQFLDTDGCCKQYRCGNSIYLNSLLSSEHGITIDHAVNAPGHGKDIVDGLNATDKNFLKKKMCLIGTPGAQETKQRMEAAAMVNGASKSLAEECIRLCNDEERVCGLKGGAKNAKREMNARLKRRHYHLHSPEAARFVDLKMRVAGLPSGRYKGIGAMYNIRTDPELGLGTAAVRRIPCCCEACVTQLKKPWRPGTPAKEQERYEQNRNCQWWSIFEGENDWNIIKCVPGKEANPEQIEETQDVVLEGLATMMAETVEVGGNGAFLADDDRYDGYYIVRWTSSPYTLQEDLLLEEFVPPIRIEAGELVCDAVYWETLPRAKHWWYPKGETDTVTVRMQQVVASNLRLDEISTTNKLPNTCRKREATSVGARRISNHDHDEILDEIARRDALEYEEEEPEEEEIIQQEEEDEESEEENEEGSLDSEPE